MRNKPPNAHAMDPTALSTRWVDAGWMYAYTFLEFRGPVALHVVTASAGAYLHFVVQCANLVQTYAPLIREELHWWEQKGITKDLLDRSIDAKVHPDNHAITDNCLSLMWLWKAIVNIFSYDR